MSSFGFGGVVSIALHIAVILAVYNLRALPPAGFQLDGSTNAITIELSVESSSEAIELITARIEPIQSTPVTVASTVKDLSFETPTVDLADLPQTSPVVNPPVDIPRHEIDPKQEPIETQIQAESLAATPVEVTVPVPVGSNDRAADLSENLPPAYPLEAVRGRMEGIVLLTLLVNVQGEVTFVEVRSSSGYPVLDSAAIEAVKKWKGKPAERSGIAIESKETLPIRFRL